MKNKESSLVSLFTQNIPNKVSKNYSPIKVAIVDEPPQVPIGDSSSIPSLLGDDPLVVVEKPPAYQSKISVKSMPDIQHDIGATVEECSISPPEEEIVDSLAKAFLNRFSPWQGRYKIKGDQGWLTKNKRLYFSSIRKAIKGELTIGFFTSFNTQILGIDIDEHSLLLNRKQALDSCKNTYNEVVTKLGFFPSLTVQSSRGIHVFYLLSDLIYWKSLVFLVKNKLHINETKLKIEILPTANSSLRIPSVIKLLDPETLDPITADHPHYSDWNSLTTFTLEDLFGTDWSKEFYKTRSKERTIVKTREIPKTETLEYLESTLLPLQNGNTYRPIFQFTVACIKIAMERDTIVEYLFGLLLQSPGYTGSLLYRDKELENRVDHIIENGHSNLELPSINSTLFIYEKYKAPFGFLFKIHPFTSYKNTGIRVFIEKLAKWKEWHDSILKDPDAASYFDQLYSYYIKNRREGFYPLPSSVLKKWDSRYYKITAWLLKIGVIQKSPYTYSARYHICKYYRISFDHLPPETQ